MRITMENPADAAFYANLANDINARSREAYIGDYWKGIAQAEPFDDCLILTNVSPYETISFTIKSDPAETSVILSDIRWSNVSGKHDGITDLELIGKDGHSLSDIAQEVLKQLEIVRKIAEHRINYETHK